MTSSVPIPDEAYEAADRWLANKSDDDDLLGAIDVAAPYIDRAARIDVLRKWIVRCEDMYYSSPDRIADVMRRELAELEAPENQNG